jgi:hypothetical protein
MSRDNRVRHLWIDDFMDEWQGPPDPVPDIVWMRAWTYDGHRDNCRYWVALRLDASAKVAWLAGSWHATIPPRDVRDWVEVERTHRVIWVSLTWPEGQLGLRTAATDRRRR